VCQHISQSLYFFFTGPNKGLFLNAIEFSFVQARQNLVNPFIFLLFQSATQFSFFQAQHVSQSLYFFLLYWPKQRAVPERHRIFLCSAAPTC